MNAIDHRDEPLAAMFLARAEALLGLRKLVESRAAFDHAQALGADADACSSGRWMTSLLAGDFEAGWQESDAIRRRGSIDPHRYWNGESLQGEHVMVRCLHGFGDAVQMLRYAPRLSAMAASAVFEVPPRMLELAQCFRGVEDVITWGEDAPSSPVAWDVQIEVMELPYIFRTALKDLPIETRYVVPPTSLVSEVVGMMGKKSRKRVGLVWAAGEWNPGRAIPTDVLRPLLEDQEIEVWSLQGGAAAAEAATLGIADATRICGEGLMTLAATIAQMDLVITVDTLAAHMAGAIGKPVFVMLQHSADWRWMTEREDSPWYPTMRLFRQPVQGDWASVVEAVRIALTTL